MTQVTLQRSATLLRRASSAISLFVMLVGSIVLAGWLLNIELIKYGFVRDTVTMKANTAIAFVSSGWSLWLLQHRHRASRFFAQVLAANVALIGLLTLSQYIFGWDLGIDQSLFRDDSTRAGFSPGRMGLNTALSFVLVGGALGLSAHRRDRLQIVQGLTLGAGLISLQTLVSYLYEVQLFQGLALHSPQMSAATAFVFMVLCAGILCLDSDQGVMKIVTSDRPSDITARWLLFAAIAVPLVLGWLILKTQREGYITPEFAISLLIFKIIVVFSVLIWLNTIFAHRIERERKQTAIALQESVEQFDFALDAAGLGHWNWNLISGKLISSSQQERLFGLIPGRGDLVELPARGRTYKTFLKQIYPDDRRSVIHKLKQAQQNYQDEFRVVWADKSIHWLALKGQFYYNETGRAVRMSGVCIDITLNKLMEAEQQQLLALEQHARARSEAANRIKDEFLLVLSHELRTPMNSILGWSRILKGRSIEEARLAQGLETIERNAKIQLQIVNDLLDVSQIVQGKLALDLSPVDPIVAIEAAISTIRPTAEAKNIQLEMVCNPIDGVILADFTRLQQVIWNLLTNAVKFTPAKGYVKISLEQVGSWVHLYVSDTGKGISAQFLPYVFDRFRQEDSSTTRSFGGLGLGLSIVRNLVELHGGTISVKSAGDNLGAAFLVKLPLRSS
ncbi:PAS domain-containing sensor histidine kinase [Phormidesmis priestleyi]